MLLDVGGVGTHGLAERNPQKYVDNIFLADEGDFIKATQRVFSSTDHATRLEVGVLPASDDEGKE